MENNSIAIYKEFLLSLWVIYFLCWLCTYTPSMNTSTVTSNAHARPKAILGLITLSLLNNRFGLTYMTQHIHKSAKDKIRHYLKYPRGITNFISLHLLWLNATLCVSTFSKYLRIATTLQYHACLIVRAQLSGNLFYLLPVFYVCRRCVIYVSLSCYIGPHFICICI